MRIHGSCSSLDNVCLVSWLLMMSPSSCAQVPKNKLPNCTVCRGCNTELSPIITAGKITYFNRTFTPDGGAGPGWMHRATTNRTASGVAMVKIFCMPMSKIPGNNRVMMCDPANILKKMKVLLGIAKLAEE